jgi:hypothetical protein
MVKKKSTTKKKKTEDPEKESMVDLKKKIKHQKDALTKIIKTYTHEK